MDDRSEGVLLVHSQDDEHRVLLRSQIKVGEEVYQRQQDTLIVWSDEDIDMALSFQDVDDCTEIWDDISDLQQHYSEDLFTDSADAPGDHTAADYPPLPNPDLSNLKDITDILKAARTDMMEKERLGTFIVLNNYIDKLFPVLETCEDLESLTDLYQLREIILAINESGAGDKKHDYREFLTKRARFKQVVPINDAGVEQRIHHVFRLQFLRDTVLMRFMDDGLFQILGSLIFFNNIDIVNAIHQNRPFLRELFGIIDRAEESMDRKRDVVRFVQQFCATARTTQMSTRIGLYRTLCQCGLFNIFEMALADSERAIKMAGAEIMMSALEHDASLVRGYIVRQADTMHRKQDQPQQPQQQPQKQQDQSQAQSLPQRQQLFDVLLDQFLVEKDAGVMTQISELIRVLLDTNPNLNENCMPAMIDNSTRVDSDADRFLILFYKTYSSKLLSPLLNLDSDETVFDRHLATSCECICNILSFMVRQHSFRSKYLILSAGIIGKLCLLLKNRDQHLRLSALKVFRTCVGMNEDYYSRYFANNDVIKCIFNLLLENGSKNNLVNSVCLEFFDHLRVENNKILLRHVVKTYRDRLAEITYTDTFKKLIDHWERFHLQDQPQIQLQQQRKQHHTVRQQHQGQQELEMNTTLTADALVKQTDVATSVQNHYSNVVEEPVVMPDQTELREDFEGSSRDAFVSDTDNKDVPKLEEENANGEAPEQMLLSDKERSLRNTLTEGAERTGEDLKTKPEARRSRGAPADEERLMSTPVSSSTKRDAEKAEIGQETLSGPVPEKRKRLERAKPLTSESCKRRETVTRTRARTNGSGTSVATGSNSSKSRAEAVALKDGGSRSRSPSPKQTPSPAPLNTNFTSAASSPSAPLSPLSPLPPIPMRTGIIFVKASMDVSGSNSCNSNSREQSTTRQAAMQLKSDLATGLGPQQPNLATVAAAAHTVKRRRDEEDGSSDLNDAKANGRPESRRRLDQPTTALDQPTTA
ncbi:Platinum sensitivity protein [Dissophora globulifera]|uniref:Platinum sensitivity protein n=1 Tax=Dissophora globulifera TaxID=979702 RepID=A0A9P6RTC5_9FUNG|nr:Platinum sensitivity protein [Dissophora globulifera]